MKAAADYCVQPQMLSGSHDAQMTTTGEDFQNRSTLLAASEVQSQRLSDRVTMTPIDKDLAANKVA